MLQMLSALTVDYSIIIGSVVAVLVISITALYDVKREKAKSEGNEPKKGILQFIVDFKGRKKRKEEKLKEIDEKLREVTGVEKELERSEEVSAEKNLIDKMHSGALVGKNIEENITFGIQNSGIQNIDFDDLTELEPTSEVNEALPEEFNTGMEEDIGENDVKGKDSLIESLQKELSIKREEKLNLMRDLEGQKLDTAELESELKEILSRIKHYEKYLG
ncbi:hypothetical protein Asulf_00849 [Archaeoglobus sulfaticallidus PM70-1]|uniref:Uncharacterized protein n=1 Tax=Archaeoglobus sulfaticallidus PM70-1 TaxID=387631 RepID=N0BF06_9EURY|nr:hypothetical protein [Archaeoglobus sulfaticallidus]AGK60857.1 hypothetical protein Asulf_00849 [Archaeoglobus sulfaticallidus PM70-1]